MRTTRTSLGRLAALALLLAGLVTAQGAAADSISYVKDGNVFLTTPDGSHTAQVTTSGGYASASQADDGRIIASHGSRLRLLSRYGDVLADFSPVAAGTAGSVTLSGPYDPAISPDGTKVAYGFNVQYKSGDPNCGKPGGCMIGQLYAGTGYSRSTEGVDWSAAGFQPEWGWMDPSWIGNDRTLISGADSAFITETAIDTPGASGNAMEWFSDNTSGSLNLFDGELSRDGGAVAFVTNSNGDHLRIWRTPTAPATGVVPQACLDAPAQGGGGWSSPSWAPDGQRLVAAGGGGLYIATLPNIAAACPPDDQVKVTVIAPGARSPDWGPADVPGPRPAAAPAPNAQGGAQPGPGGSGATATPLRLTVGRIALAAALRRGLGVTVRCTTGAAVVIAHSGSRRIGAGKATCRSGRARVLVRFAPATRSALRGRRALKLTLDVTAGGLRANRALTLRQ